MKYDITPLEKSEVTLHVHLDQDDLQDFVRETEKELINSAKIEGFRQGKVPRDVLIKKIGENTIREEALQHAIEDTLAEIILKEKFDVITQKDFGIKENTKEMMNFNITLVLFPTIKLGNYKGISIKKNDTSVSKDEIDNVLKDVARSRTAIKDVERPAKMGDRVEVDFDVSEDGKTIEGGHSENHPVILGEKKFVDGFEDAIVDMKMGETKELDITMPKDYFQESIAGKTLHFKIGLKRVSETSLPELNDEFAKSLGKFTTISEVENNIEQGLQLEKEAKEKDRLHLLILEEIAKNTPIEVPDMLIEQRLDSMLTSFDQELHQNGMELGLYLAHIKKTQEDLRKDWRAQAETQVKYNLITREIAKQENIVVSEEDLNEQLQLLMQQFMMQQGANNADALKNIDPEKIKLRIYDTLMQQKVFELLDSNTTFTS